MNWIENLLIVAGASLDIFVYMECQGSLVRRVNKKHLCGICAFVTSCQLVALFLGHCLSDAFCRRHLLPNEAVLGELVAVAIFFCLGVRLMGKAIRNEQVEERLETKPDMHRLLLRTGISSIYMACAGIAFGFLHTNIVYALLMLVVFTVVCTVSGMYVGYRFGIANKSKVYTAGALLLWGAGVEVLIRSVLPQM